MHYTITEAKIDKDRILVSAAIQDGEQVHELNTAFTLDTSAEEIRAEVEKAVQLHELEKTQKEAQAKVDEVFEKANDTINNLISQ